MPIPDDIIPEDSFVLDVWSTDHEVALLVQAALAREHPCFYWPPKPGEFTAYAHIMIRLRGNVTWHRGPLPKRAQDASGEFDYGDLSSWHTSHDGTEHLDGGWGDVVVTNATQVVELRTDEL